MKWSHLEYHILTWAAAQLGKSIETMKARVGLCGTAQRKLLRRNGAKPPTGQG